MIKQVICGNSLEILQSLPSESVDCIVTSPPYWNVRVYGQDDHEIGRESTFLQYIDNLNCIFNECYRILKKEGTCFINIADTYSGNKKGKTDNKVSDYLKNETAGIQKISQHIKDKSLCNIPHRLAIAMTDNGWIHRNNIIWYKRNAMPSSVKDRFTVDYETVLFLTKSKKYYFKQQFEPYTLPSDRWGGIYTDGVYQNSKYQDKTHLPGANTGENNKKPYASNNPHRQRINNTHKGRLLTQNTQGRNMRCVWEINTKPSKIPHFAMYPESLVERMILAGCPENGVVLDPFAGAGNTMTTAKKLRRGFIGIELYPKYIDIINERLK